jgi:cytochrome c oxidase assembly protein subunit 11
VQDENKPGIDGPAVNKPGSGKDVKHKKVIIPMIIYASLMFGLGFAMVPLYDMFCEVTGIKDTAARKAIVEYTIDRTRSVRVEFDATINQELAFEFRPMTTFIEVNPGEINVVDFFVKNNTGRDVIAQAIPSVTPVLATTHLNKIECFCFEQQKLKAGEEKIMPLRFVLGTGLPEEISTVTLSYTFMDINRDKLQKNLNDAEKELKELI